MAGNLEPVEIDITMRQNVSEESEKASKGMSNMAESSKELEEIIGLQKKAIRNLEKQYADAKVAFDTFNKSSMDSEFNKKRAEASRLFKEVKKELEDEKKALENLEAAYKKSASSKEKQNKSQATAITQMRRIREEMIALELEGKKESDRYIQLSAELEKLGTAYRVVSQEQKLLTSGGSSVAGVISGLSGVAGAATAVQGAFSLVIKDNEQLAKIQTKLQAAMSITMGLQQVSNALHQTSAFRINLMTKATRLWNGAVKTLNANLGISMGLSKGLVGIGIGALIAGVAVAIKKYQDWNRQKEETIRLNRIVTDSMKNVAIEGAKSAEEETTSLKLLYKASQDETKSKKERLKAADEIQKQYPSYFANLSKEEILAGKGAAAYNNLAKSILAAAKARAAADKITDNQLKILDLEEKIAEAENKKNKAEIQAKKYYSEAMKESYGELGIQHTLGNIQLAQREDSKVNDLTKEINNYGTEITKLNEANEKLAETINVEDLLFDSKKDAKNYKKEASGLEKERKKKEKANEDLLKKTKEYQDKIDATAIKAIEKGAEKQREAAKAEFEKTKRQIEQERRELDSIEEITGKPATEQRELLDEWDQTALDAYNAKVKEINDKARADMDEIFASVTSRSASQLDNEILEINGYYNELIKKAKEAGATQQQIRELNKARTLETEHVKQNAQLRTLEFEEEMAQRRMAISGKFYLFESDKIKDSLISQKTALEERLKILQLQYEKTPTDELAEDIEDTTVSIEELNAEIKKLPASKFIEIAGYINQIAGGLSGLFPEGSSAGQLLEWSSAFAESAMNLAKGIASGDPQAIINGAVSAISTVTNIIGANRKAEKEIKEFYKELEQIALSYAISVINTIKDITASTDSIFSTDLINSLTRSMEGYYAALNKEKDLISQLGDVTVQTGKKKKKFLGITTGTKKVWEDLLTGYKKVLKTDEELIDANGQLNREIAEALLNSGKLSKEAEALIKNILAAQDAATAAMEQFEGVLSNIAGNIGDDLRNALVDAFKSGDVTSAADAFGKSAASILEDWISQVAFSAIFGEMMADLEQQMKDSFGSTGDQDITDDIADFMAKYGSGVEDYMKALEEWKKQLKELYDIDIFSDGEREGASAGIASITQDSANELNGNFYALRQQVGDIRNMQKEANMMREAMYRILVGIAENTEFCRYLLDVKNGVDDISQRGVKVRV